ncbi:MAG: PD-(D/E)XK nuclease family protein [Candidatus Paceibacterota bacterium]
MPQDKYTSVWVSHSSIGDFLKCPRSYYLKNVYKNKNGKKVNIVNSSLSLGGAVHETVEGLAKYRAEERFKQPIAKMFEENWEKISGKRGGFKDKSEEEEIKERGRKMIKRVIAHPGPLLNKTVKIKEGKNGMPPNFFLSEDDNIILCGKIDWLEYVPEDDSVRVIDFKTGKNDEKEDSLQLPIYRLILNELQKRKVTGASYWYLDRDDVPTPVILPEIKEAREKVLAIAKKVKDTREKKEYLCPRGEKGCFACQPFEKILKGEAEFVGQSDWQDLFIV